MDSHNLNIYWGVIIITLMTIIGGLIENVYRIKSSRGTYNVKALYEILNFNLSLSLGIIALFWEKDTSNPKILILIGLFVAVGVVSKVLFSNHQPERISLKDKDFRWGVIIPNAFAVSAISIIILRESFEPRWVVVLLISLFVSFPVSFLVGYLIELLIKDKLPTDVRQHIAHLELIIELLRQSKKRSLTEIEKNKICSALMSYCMKTDSEYRAIDYINEVCSIVQNKELKKNSLEIIEGRFSKCKECTR